MFQIAIVDDRAEDAEALARMVRACRHSSEACATGEGISTFATVDALSARMDGGYAPDIVFVDIVLDPDAAQDGPAPTGIDAVERLFGTGSAAQIVYVSGYDEFHTKVYRTRHAAYLSKPFSEEDVSLALDLALAARESVLEKPLTLRVKGVERVVRPSDILYLESTMLCASIPRAGSSRPTVSLSTPCPSCRAVSCARTKASRSISTPCARSNPPPSRSSRGRASP